MPLTQLEHYLVLTADVRQLFLFDRNGVKIEINFRR
jgi:hypothetical protein